MKKEHDLPRFTPLSQKKPLVSFDFAQHFVPFVVSSLPLKNLIFSLQRDKMLLLSRSAILRFFTFFKGNFAIFAV
jgi:hypothetical protein